jgi:hypothetical protein
MAYLFEQTLGPTPDPQGGGRPAFVDPYEAQREALRQKLAQQQAPMYTPEQVAQRRQQNDDQYALGLLGQLSGNKEAGGIGGQVLKQAMDARTQRITERGTADPITGAFTYSPDFLRARDEQSLAGLDTKSAAAQQADLLERQRFSDKQELQARDIAARQELRAMMGANGQGRQAAQDESRRWRFEDAMRGDFDRITKDTREELGAVQKLKTTIGGYVGRRMDGQAQQSVVILLNKFLDPGSVVREGEFDRVVKAQGLMEQAKNYINRVESGEFMTAKGIADIARLANIYEEASTAKMRKVAGDYTNIANARGLDPMAIISDPTYRPAQKVEIDAGAALGKPAPKQSLPKSNPSGGNRLVVEQ